MVQVNLQVYHYIGQEISRLESMARQVGACILDRIIEERKKLLANEENKQILLLCQENANRMIKKSKELISKLKEFPEFGGS